MNPTECPRARRVVRALIAVLIAFSALAVVSCSDPEKTKAEHLRRGEAFLKERKYQQAALEFRNALQIDDNLAAAHWGLAQAYEKLERIPEAFEELQRAVKLDPTNKDARFKLGSYYLLAGHSNNQIVNPQFLDEAQLHAEELINQDENFINGHILLANVLAVRGERGKALERINHAIQLDPNRIETFVSLATFYWSGGETAKAEETYRRAIQMNENGSLARVEYGKFLVQQKRLDEAEAQFRRAVEGDPLNHDVHWVLASFYLVNNRLDKAEAAYKALADLDRDRPEGRAKLADFYAMVGRRDEALQLYQENAQQFPDYARGHYRIGELMLQQGNLEGASAQVGEILKKNAGDLDALLLRARVNLARSQVKEAIADLKKVLDQEPRSLMALYFMSEAQYSDEQVDQARSYAGELERFHPSFMPARLMQVQLSLATGDAQQAKRQATELLEKLKESAPSAMQTPQLLVEIKGKALAARGLAQLELGEIAAARADMQAARDISPNSPDSHVGLARVAVAEGKGDEAKQHVEQALARDRVNTKALSALIGLAALEKRLDEVRGRLDQLVSEEPNTNSAPLHYLRGQAYGTYNDAQPPDLQRAEESMRRAIEIDSKYIPAYEALAALYLRTGQPDRAVVEYLKITELRPDHANAYLALGMIESGRGNHEAAEQYYRRVLSIRPNDPVSANNLAALYSEYGRGNGDEAMRLAQEVVRRFPDNAGFADTLGWVYYKNGLYPSAVEQLRKAVNAMAAAGKDRSLYRYHLGMALAAKGDKAAARRELQRAIELAELEQQRPDKPGTPTPVDEARRTLESL